MTHTAMSGGRCQSNQVEQSTSSDGDYVGMTINMVTIEVRMNL
jgi:hypothetical protein